MELDQPQPDCPTTCGVAQQYSLATFVSLHFSFPQGKNVCFSKCVFFKNAT
jgi:hypothetical protein